MGLNLTIDQGNSSAKIAIWDGESLVDEENVELTFKEYELLRLFLSNLGIVLTREIIMETVWGMDFAGESRTVDMHIKTLRKKLKEAGSLIITVRNVGYKLE